MVCIGQCIVWGLQPEPLCKQFPLLQSSPCTKGHANEGSSGWPEVILTAETRVTGTQGWCSSMPGYGTPLRWLTVGVSHSGFLNQICENSLIGTCSFFWFLINNHSYTSPTQILVFGYCKNSAVQLKALSYCTNRISPESQLKTVHFKVDPINIFSVFLLIYLVSFVLPAGKCILTNKRSIPRQFYLFGTGNPRSWTLQTNIYNHRASMN